MTLSVLCKHVSISEKAMLKKKRLTEKSLSNGQSRDKNDGLEEVASSFPENWVEIWLVSASGPADFARFLYLRLRKSLLENCEKCTEATGIEAVEIGMLWLSKNKLAVVNEEWQKKLQATDIVLSSQWVPASALPHNVNYPRNSVPTPNHKNARPLPIDHILCQQNRWIFINLSNLWLI